MGRYAKADAQRAGPRLWARFLKRHFGGVSLAQLNAQLLQPEAPHEAFEFGKEPRPLPLRLAPKIFERAYSEGRTPDGHYNFEASGKESRFNLYERVTRRVPESKYWLLKETDHFLAAGPPAIDSSIRVLRQILRDLNLLLPERKIVEAWQTLDRNGLEKAASEICWALHDGRLPEYLALILVLLHISIWSSGPDRYSSLASELKSLSVGANLTFADSLERLNFDDPELLWTLLAERDRGSLDPVLNYGSRSMASYAFGPLPELGCSLMLVADTADARKAIATLMDATEFHGRMKIYIGNTIESQTPSQILEAVAGLKVAAETARDLLISRAACVLGGYRGIYLPLPPKQNRWCARRIQMRAESIRLS